MADLSGLPGLLDRAGNVFSLAGKLGRAFHEERQSRLFLYDPSIWERHAPTFDEFYKALLELRDAMQNPPDGFARVDDELKKAARIARRIRAAIKPGDKQESWSGEPLGLMLGIKNPGPPAFTAYHDFCRELIEVSESGAKAVNEVAKARQLDDPLAFVDEPCSQNAAGDPEVTPRRETDNKPDELIQWVISEIKRQGKRLTGPVLYNRYCDDVDVISERTFTARLSQAVGVHLDNSKKSPQGYGVLKRDL